MISITQAAAEQIRAAAKQAEADNMALRIAAKVNQEGMLEFGMGFDNERSDDSLVESWGVTLLISQHSAPLLDDVTLDFAEVSPGQQSFIFMKPDMGAPEVAVARAAAARAAAARAVVLLDAVSKRRRHRVASPWRCLSSSLITCHFVTLSLV